MVHIIALAVCIISWAASCGAMVYDNQFFPLIEKPIYRREGTCLFFRAQPFVMFASSAFNSDGECDDAHSGAGLFETQGLYDETVMDHSLLATGRTSALLLPSNVALYLLPWTLNGNLTSAGVAFQWYYKVARWMEVGGSFFFMGDRNVIEMALSRQLSIPAITTEQQLYSINQQILAANGTPHQIWNHFGLSDLDFYVRFGVLKKFLSVFRTFDFGTSLGVLVPTAAKRELDNPASIPFGGNGHWGFYGDINTLFEFKEDMFFGLQFRFIQRLQDTHAMRVPVNVSVPLLQQTKEQYTDPLTNKLITITKSSIETRDKVAQPTYYGSLTVPVTVKPGFTFVFSPYVALHGLRGGFGVELAYNMIIHRHDDFIPRKQVSLVNSDKLIERSPWNKEYLTFSALYDFGYDKEDPGASPRIYFDVDVPVSFFIAKNAPKTFGISLRIESDLW